MSRFVSVHFLSERAPTDRRAMRTACGQHGLDEGCNEFTTLDGREARLEYTERPDDVTCKRCLSWLTKKMQRD